MKIAASDLVTVVFDAHERGRRQGASDLEHRVYESTKALVAENSSLKTEISSLETRLMAKDQKDSFLAVRTEQRRIVQKIVDTLPLEEAKSLVQSLCLGDA